MYKIVKDDIFNSPADIIVNTVNTCGVMGKGLALKFKKRYPDMFLYYKKLCDDKIMKIGKLFLYKNNKRNILLFPTKDNWRFDSKMEYIIAGLETLSKKWDKLGVNSIAFPMLGCGNGGLKWSDVEKVMSKYLNRIPILSIIYVDNRNDNICDDNDIMLYNNFYKIKNDFDDFVKIFKSTYTNENSCIEYEYNMQDINHYWLEIKNKLIIEKKINDKKFTSFFECLLHAGLINDIVISKDGFNFSNNANGYTLKHYE